LPGNLVRFREFLQEANAADAGAAALEKYFGVTLESLVADYLGDGDWASRPSWF